jgi:putative ABC transport system permease protein
LNTINIRETLDFIEKKWDELYPFLPYEGFFLDQEFDRQYRAEEQIGKLLGIITATGLVIACLGLLGLAAFTAQQRTKEIGIRKVLGASVPNITLMFLKSFSLRILLGNIIAWPAAYYAGYKWLENFAYRINIAPWIFVAAAALALVVALLTVSYQILKAALANPADSLRYE